MINERVEVRDYLQGKNLHRDIEYRICLLLAKWYYEQGNTTVPAIREKLKIWAKDNNFYFNVSMNTIANRVIDGQMKLQGDFPIYISRTDIDIIQKHFDSYYERIVALAVLCYSKAYAKDNKFKISKGRYLFFRLAKQIAPLSAQQRLRQTSSKYVYKQKTV